MTTESIHETVRRHYADAAVRAAQGTGSGDPETIEAAPYSGPADARPLIDLSAQRDVAVAEVGCCGGTGCC